MCRKKFNKNRDPQCTPDDSGPGTLKVSVLNLS